MTHWAFYNENDPQTAAWLRELMKQGLIPYGDVDCRDIRDVDWRDILHFTQCHFFAGIGGWSEALRLAQWPIDRPVWTGSCPCQPFSVAGKRKGASDERHLWPAWFRLIEQCRPPIIFGEQVAAAISSGWLDGSSDMRRMRDRETLIRILQEHGLERRIPSHLQDMLWGSGANTEGADSSRDESCSIQSLSKGETSQGATGSSQAPGKAKGFALQPFGNADTDDNRCGLLPVDGDSFQLRQRQNLGQPFDRSNQLSKGLHAGQRESDPLLHKCNGEYMGREQNYRDIECAYGNASASIRGSSKLPNGIVESSNQLRQFAGVCADLENAGYAVGAAVLPACGVDAPHKRERLWFVADAATGRLRPRLSETGQQEGRGPYRRRGLADADGERLEEWPSVARNAQPERAAVKRSGDAGSGLWRDAEFIVGPDGKARRVKPGVRLLADGVPARVAKLRGFGNAIVPACGAAFIKAIMDVT